MKGSPNSTCLGSGCGGRNVLAHSESAELSRLAGLAERLFHVPVAYAAMLGHCDRVMSRIGSGEAHWKHLKTFPVTTVLDAPMVLRDVREGVPEGADLGDLQFLASAPIDTYCGQHLGVLVIADHQPRPEFSEQDLKTLVEMARVMAASIELRMMAWQSIESQLKYDEAEERFRGIANLATPLIGCIEANGSCEFVNDAWLKFTGRYIQKELGKGWQQDIHHQHRELALTLYWHALQTQQPFTLEAPFRRYDGVFRWLRGSGTPRFLKDGSFSGFIVSLTDVCNYT